jgi:hypothetical protein
MPSHPQPDQDEQHDEENQKPSANFCVPREEVHPKREDDDQKPPANDDGVNDEKESPMVRVQIKSEKNPPALSGISSHAPLLYRMSSVSILSAAFVYPSASCRVFADLASARQAHVYLVGII